MCSQLNPSSDPPTSSSSAIRPATLTSDDNESHLGAHLPLPPAHNANLSSFKSESDSELSDPPSDIDDLEFDFALDSTNPSTKSPRHHSSTMRKKPAKRSSDQVDPAGKDDEESKLPDWLAGLSIKKPRLDKDLSAIERLPTEVRIYSSPLQRPLSLLILSASFCDLLTLTDLGHPSNR